MLEDNIFNECKSDLKFLEYAMCNIQMISNNIGPYKDLGSYKVKNRMYEISKLINRLESIPVQEQLLNIEKQKEIATRRQITDNYTIWLDMLNRL
jgi:hypothetical protein